MDEDRGMMKMKRMKIYLTGILLLTGMSACTEEPGITDDTVEITVRRELPVKLEYDRMWIYGAYGESDDPEYIAKVTELIAAMELAEETDIVVEDYTDRITLVYADDTEVTYIFEEYNYVSEDGKRYIVNGDLSGLRTLLEELVKHTIED